METTVREPHGGSHVHCEPIEEGGAQLCPCDIATATPQAFTVASGTGDLNRPRSSQHLRKVLVRIADQPESTGFGAGGRLERR